MNIPNPQPSLPPIAWPDKIVETFEAVMHGAGALAMFGAVIFAILIVWQLYGDLPLRIAGSTFAIGWAASVLVAMLAGGAVSQWGYFATAILVLPALLLIRWGVRRFLNRAMY